MSEQQMKRSDFKLKRNAVRLAYCSGKGDSEAERWAGMSQYGG